MTQSSTVIIIVVIVTPASPSTHSGAHPAQWTIRRELLRVAIVPRIDLVGQFPTNSVRKGSSLLLIQHLLHLPSTSTSIVDFLAVDHRSWLARVDTLPYFAFPVEVGEGDVEAMNMGRDYCQEEEDAVEDNILIEACQEQNGGGWEDDVKDADEQAFEHRD